MSLYTKAQFEQYKRWSLCFVIFLWKFRNQALGEFSHKKSRKVYAQVHPPHLKFPVPISTNNSLAKFVATKQGKELSSASMQRPASPHWSYISVSAGGRAGARRGDSTTPLRRRRQAKQNQYVGVVVVVVVGGRWSSVVVLLCRSRPRCTLDWVPSCHTVTWRGRSTVDVNSICRLTTASTKRYECDAMQRRWSCFRRRNWGAALLLVVADQMPVKMCHGVQ